jgi:hypothetical protein
MWSHEYMIIKERIASLKNSLSYPLTPSLAQKTMVPYTLSKIINRGHAKQNGSCDPGNSYTPAFLIYSKRTSLHTLAKSEK